MKRLQTHTFVERKILFSTKKILRTIFVSLKLNKLGALNKFGGCQGKYIPPKHFYVDKNNKSILEMKQG